MQRGTDKPVTLEAVQLVRPTPAQLSEYAGNFRSEEVQASYRIVFEDGKLFLRHENDFKRFPKNALEPTIGDSFIIQGINIQFARDTGRRVSAFTLNAGRVKNIRFVRTSG